MPISPLMLDLEGTVLTAEEKELLQHPYCGGIIFFSRNFESMEQLQVLIRAVRTAAPEDFLISVDHEGGRVQRFREGFTHLPALAKLYEQSEDELAALRAAHHHAWLMSSELRSMGIDFSFAPVLDLNYGISEVIGDRAFHAKAEIVGKMAVAYVEGMHEAGMAATGKHFPGHGAIVADSHTEIPVDERSLEALSAADMQPFAQLIREGLDAIMPAHVIYPEVDSQPAGFSQVWLQQILRQQLGFDGVIFSDDLNMEGASLAGNYAQRAEVAIGAGCDMVLLCNNRAGVIQVMDEANINLKSEQSQRSMQRLERMKGRQYMNRSALLDTQRWCEIEAEMRAFV
ncbi:MAG: beta-N-acetylhexosaminidase [Proteobacteria bacterium]|nr:MAG: beta-N-acetylhexosaminidase [Pseudomonadota bacterium]